MVRLRTLLPVAAFVMALALPLSAQSRRGEMRGVGLAAGGGNEWPALMRTLRENGFNGVFASFFTGASTLYPSRALPAAGEPGARDELGLAIRAARENDVEFHFWLRALSMYGAPADVTAQLEAANRLQRGAQGRLGRDDPAVAGDWLCPSHPDNRKLLAEITAEVVGGYDPPGLLVSHLGFPNAGYCLCERCRAGFEESIGVKVEAWPEEVLTGRRAEAWQRWRRALVTGLMEEVSEAARRVKPEIFISFAPHGSPDESRDARAEEWPSWVRGGMLDFVCPVVEGGASAELLREQVEAGRGAVPVYLGGAPAEGASSWELIQQVEASRGSGMDGFVLFVSDQVDYRQWLSALRATVAAADADPMPHRSPRATFKLGGPAAAAPATGWRVIGNARLEVELTIGTPPVRTEEGLADGADYVSSVLRRATDARRPTTEYEPSSLPVSEPEDLPRISGRVVVEDPSGMSLASLTAFDADGFVKRKLRLTTPVGPFRIAVYGSFQAGAEEAREFVVRSPLLVGAEVAELGAAPEARHAELDRLAAAACERIDLTRLEGNDMAIQLVATGPGGGEWWLRLGESGCETGSGRLEEADLTLTCSAEDALALGRGETDARLLWEAGRLQATGDYELLRLLTQLVAR